MKISVTYGIPSLQGGCSSIYNIRCTNVHVTSHHVRMAVADSNGATGAQTLDIRGSPTQLGKNAIGMLAERGHRIHAR
jgi:hypothetical protein